MEQRKTTEQREVPVFGKWKYLYIFVLIAHALVILFLYLFTIVFS